MSCLQSWPEPIVRVQSLSESGIKSIPERYIKPLLHRPSLKTDNFDDDFKDNPDHPRINIPVIDLQDMLSSNKALRDETLRHTYPTRVASGEYANSPTTYEGYGSRLGVEKGANMDWSDQSLRNQSKWPALPSSCRYAAYSLTLPLNLIMHV
ncbi:hypothetical protein EZV62_016768 [Acer yangbiense]|uniref:Uncharacterized protein n=1 Tax=Acer yangbiense TaxID=1000413 RepID=A0A5C7HQ22_9ROSI|nr:hypothetical protein EZV62_016768 [Acer yangbiense]